MKYIELIKLAKKYGFVLKRQNRGSHETWVNQERKVAIIIARHGSKEISKGLAEDLIKKIKGE